ncbi:MAG: MerR family transcriptional regulator [Tatlockia sp.]|nr:MerR family transcriptional regulator [Tatlockia sp.]
MTKWHIKEISELTQTSIRMLRHYDKIDLLNPSYRESNGYRCYTEPDLAKLQQIIALKYFGFSLSTIKSILQKHNNIYAHLQAQQQIVKKQSAHLKQVNDVLEDILKGLSPSKSPDWNDLLLLIEGFNMTNNLREKLKESWAGKQLTASQFEDYLFLYEKFPVEFAQRDAIVEEINQKKVGDPEGPDGERIVNFVYALGKKMKQFFTQNVKLSSSLLESIQSGKLTQLEISPEGYHWLGKATVAYWLKRWNFLYEKIVDNLSSDPKEKVGKELSKDWRTLIDDHMAIGSKDFLTGIMLWQEAARQDQEMKALKTMPSPQEMLEKVHIKLLFNPEAASWISQALELHAR